MRFPGGTHGTLLSSPREMIARLKMSRIEEKTTEMRGFKELELSHPFPAQVRVADAHRHVEGRALVRAAVGLPPGRALPAPGGRPLEPRPLQGRHQTREARHDRPLRPLRRPHGARPSRPSAPLFHASLVFLRRHTFARVASLELSLLHQNGGTHLTRKHEGQRVFGAKADQAKRISTSAGTASLAHVVLTQVEALGFCVNDAVVLRAEIEIAADSVSL